MAVGSLFHFWFVGKYRLETASRYPDSSKSTDERVTICPSTRLHQRHRIALYIVVEAERPDMLWLVLFAVYPRDHQRPSIQAGRCDRLVKTMYPPPPPANSI